MLGEEWDVGPFQTVAKGGECQVLCTRLTRPLLNPPDLVTGACTIIDSENPNVSQSLPAG